MISPVDIRKAMEHMANRTGRVGLPLKALGLVVRATRRRKFVLSILASND